MADEIEVIIVGEQGPSGQGVPAGGSTGEFLKKTSAGDFDTEWSVSSATVNSINDINDVVITGANDTEVLTWDSGTSKWINAPATGGVSDHTLLT